MKVVMQISESRAGERWRLPQSWQTPKGRRLIYAVLALALFWGALLVEYWPDLVSAVLRVVNSASSMGAETIESSHFEVRNNSTASEARIRQVVRTLEGQYDAIAEYTGTEPSEKIPVLFKNGKGPALTDGTQLLIDVNNDRADIDLIPMFLVWMIDGIPVDPQDGLVRAGGYALSVLEAADTGDTLIRQPLDNWAVLLRNRNAYLPLEEAWQVVMPSDEEGGYELMRGMLEAGSFMNWFSQQYGHEMARRLASGEPIEDLTGLTLEENEAQWLSALEAQEISPRACHAVIPETSLFYLMCRKLP